MGYEHESDNDGGMRSKTNSLAMVRTPVFIPRFGGSQSAAQ
jgi:hypothetical protein